MGRGKKIVDRGVVIEATVALIEDQGFEAFSTRRLAARLRISAMTLYNYYDNREAILKEAAISCLDRFFSDLAAEVGSSEDARRNPLRSWKIYASKLREFARTRPFLYLFLFDSTIEEIRKDQAGVSWDERLFASLGLGTVNLEALRRDVYLFELLVNGLAISALRGKGSPDDEEHLACVDRAYSLLLAPYERDVGTS